MGATQMCIQVALNLQGVVGGSQLQAVECALRRRGCLLFQKLKVMELEMPRSHSTERLGEGEDPSLRWRQR